MKDKIFQSSYIKKINLLNFDLKEMSIFFLKLGEKKFRAQQIMNWIYKKYCNNFKEMNNLNFLLKKKLYEISYIKTPKLINFKYSLDGTIKWIFQVKKKFIETIYIPEKNRATLCISSQIGCILNCSFCATGKMEYQGNLEVSEIIGQIWYIIKNIKEKNKKFNIKKKITNIVLMGMGEPLLNIKNVFKSVNIMLGQYGFGFSKHKITLSTSGISPAINKMIGNIDISLAISLHASNNKIRNKLMPINKIYNIQEVLKSVKNYLKYSKANRGMVTIEYVMLHKINDRIKNAKELSVLLKEIPCKINLIPWNPIKNISYASSKSIVIKNFCKFLTNKGFITTIRKNRGLDIQAACGQLINHIKY